MSNTAVSRKEVNRDFENEVMENSDAEVAIFELVDRMGSGFVREGTEKLPEPDELEFPGNRSILTKSAYFRKEKGKKGEKDKNIRVPIRYRADSTSIDPAVQDKDGSIANPNNDRIEIVNGRIVVVGEGLAIGKLKFMRADSRNETNPNRIPTVQPIYREIFPDKEDESSNDNDFALGAALGYLQDLIISKNGDQVVYDEHRINALRQLHGIVAETNNGAIKALIATAKINPAEFLKVSKMFEQQMATEVLQAEQLGVIEFEQNRAVYVAKNKVILTFSASLSRDQKIQQLSAYFTSEAGREDYAIFKTELNIAKEKNI